MALETLLSAETRGEYLERVGHSLSVVPERVRKDALDYVETMLSRDLPPLFDAAHLAQACGLDRQLLGTIRHRPDRFYNQFVIRKRNGGSRELAAPTPPLRAIQDWLNLFVVSQLPVHHAAHGFRRGRSILTNAEPHVGSRYVFKLDIKDFFGSVSRRQVFRAMRRLGYRREIADLLTTLLTLSDKLPQGAPTSPAVANNAAYGLDVRIAGYTGRRDIAYTRYADDITLSGVQVADSRVRRTVEKIMRDEGFAPNEAKRRYVRSDERQLVTGIVVNDKVDWPRDRRRWLRQQIHYLSRFGVESHLRARGITRARYREFIYGHVYALNMVRPDEARSYLELLDQVDWTN
jgi:retron-type reverse transcriptase